MRYTDEQIKAEIHYCQPMMSKYQSDVRMLGDMLTQLMQERNEARKTIEGMISQRDVLYKEKDYMRDKLQKVKTLINKLLADVDPTNR